jgi:iron complex transport system substrate-binding protein
MRESLRRLALLGWVAVGMSHASTVLDDRQQKIEIAKPPQRIVSLLPSLTETVCTLGACQRLVGVDRYSNWPPSAQSLPRLGGGLDPDIERVLALQPDLVLVAGSTRAADRLQALGLTVLRLEPRTHADVQRVLQVVGQALHMPPAEADRAWLTLQTQVQAAAQSLQPQARGLRVYVEVSPTPHGASEASFIGETLQRMGVVNILPAALGPFPQVNPEFVVRAQPDVAVRVDQTGHDPTAIEDGLGPAHRFTAQDPVSDPPFDGLAIGQSAAADMQRRSGHRASSYRETSAWTDRNRPGRAEAG